MTSPQTVRWRDLHKNDWIVCPVTGQIEQVTESETRTAGRWFVRTTNHYHNRPAVDPVLRADREAAT